MKRIAMNLGCSLLTFTCGLTADALWSGNNYQVPTEPSRVPHLRTNDDEFSTSPDIPFSTATPDREVIFGQGRLKIVPEEVQLKSERLQYRIAVTYPQIVGSEELHIRKLNRRIKELATGRYLWPMTPSKRESQYYRDKWPELFNSVDLDYEIRLATDSFLSIYFIEYSYGIGAAHAVQSSFVINYDLALRKELKLSDVFKRRSKYLEFISRYCVDELSKQSAYMFEEAMTPRVENFESWNVTRDAIRFNFDSCSVFSCAEGEQKVEIPFDILNPLLKSNSLRQ